MIINHNMQAINANRQLGINTTKQSKSTEKLSSGLRINRAGDDAAGLAISEKMRSQIRGLDQATRNAQDGISLIQTAEGALDETHSILQRMRELAVQAGNDTNTDQDRAELQKEVEALQDEITRISTDTEFNTQKLLDGSKGASGVTVKQAGSEKVVATEAQAAIAEVKGEYTITFTQNKEIVVDGKTIDASKTDTVDNAVQALSNDTDLAAKYTFTANNGNIKVEQKTGSATAPTATVDGANALTVVTDGVAAKAAVNVGDTIKAAVAGEYEFEKGNGEMTIDGVKFSAEDLKDDTAFQAAIAKTELNDKYTAVMDADGKITLTQKTDKESSKEPVVTGTKNDSAIVLQVGANANQTISVNIDDMGASALKATYKDADGNDVTKTVAQIDISTREGAAEAINILDEAIKTVSAQRSNLGAVQNRLEHTINNLGTSSENLTAAESRIRDVDMAKEMMEFTKQQVLSQASQSMLAQANQIPSQVLSLLQ